MLPLVNVILLFSYNTWWFKDIFYWQMYFLILLLWPGGSTVHQRQRARRSPTYSFEQLELRNWMSWEGQKLRFYLANIKFGFFLLQSLLILFGNNLLDHIIHIRSWEIWNQVKKVAVWYYLTIIILPIHIYAK